MEVVFSSERSIISDKFDSCILPRSVETSAANGQLFLVFEDTNKVSLKSWILNKDKQLSTLSAFQLVSQLLEATLKKTTNWNLVDQIAYSLSQFIDSTPVILKSADNKEFKSFIIQQYFLSLSEKFVFPYPPEILAASRNTADVVIKREPNSDVWGVGVFLLVLTGFSHEKISMLMDNIKKKEFFRSITDDYLKEILTRIFEDHPTRRISSEQLFKFIQNYLKEQDEIYRKNNPNTSIKTERQSNSAVTQNQINNNSTRWKKKKWYGHIMKQFHEKLNLKEAKQFKAAVIKCLESVVQQIEAKEKELNEQTELIQETQDEQKNQAFHQSWKNVLSDANCLTIGSFFTNAGEKALEVGEIELSKELFEAREYLIQTYVSCGQWDTVKKLNKYILTQMIQINNWVLVESYEMAFQFIQKVLTVQPKNITIAFQQGKIAKNQKDYNLAEISFKKCLEIVQKLEDPIIFNSETFSKDHFKSKIVFEIGLSQKGQSKESESEESFKDCLKLNPNHPEAYFQLGLIYQKQGKKDQLKESLQNYQRINSDTIEKLVRVFEKQELSEKALLDTIKSSFFMDNIKLKLQTLCDDFQEFFGSLGITYYKLRRLEYALCCFKVSTLINEKQQFNNNIDYTYGKCLMFSQKYQEANEVFMQFIKSRECIKIPKLKFYIGICKLKQGKTCWEDLKFALITIENRYLIPVAYQLLLGLLNEKVKEEEQKEIFNKIELIAGQNTSDICALLSQINLEYGLHPFQSMYYVEKAEQKNKFLVNKKLEDLLSKKDELKIGCLVQEARIQFQLGNIKTALQSINSVRETMKTEYSIKINENKESSDYEECYEERNLIMLNDAVKNQREGWCKVDWSSEADLLLAEIYLQKEDVDGTMKLIKSVEERNQLNYYIILKITHIKALILLRQSKINEGMALLRNNQKHESSLIELVKLLFQQGNAKEARELYATYQVRSRLCSRIQESIGDLEFEARNYCASNEFYIRYKSRVATQNDKLHHLEIQQKGLSFRKVELNPDVLAKLG